MNSIDKLVDDKIFEEALNKILLNFQIIPPEIRKDLFGKEDVLAICDDLCYASEKATACAKWLGGRISELICDEMNIKNQNIQAKRLQESFSDNPRKTLNNFIFKKASP